MIIVGIDSDQERLDLYSPWNNDPKHKDKLTKTCGGKGDLYVDWLVWELKPWIDQNYRTIKDKKNTTIAGSSMGSYISLYTICKYPDIFGNAGLFSTSLWFNENTMIDYLRSSLISPSHKFFVSVGTMEANLDPNHSSNVAYIKGSKKLSQYYLIWASEIHNCSLQMKKHHELAWSHQFVDFLKFLNDR